MGTVRPGLHLRYKVTNTRTKQDHDILPLSWVFAELDARLSSSGHAKLFFKETKERLSKRTGIKGKVFEKIRFAIVKGGQNYSRPVWVEDDDILSEKLNHDDHLGLEHPNRNRSAWVKYESLNIR